MNPNDLAHKKLEHELALYKMMVNASLDSITLIDRDYKYCIVTDAYTRARQLKKEDILNHSVADVWGKKIFNEIIKSKLDECFGGKTVSHIAAYEFEKNEINYIETIYTPCFTSGSKASYAVVISHNITELKKSQEKIEALAYYDSLTNLPSRPLFLDRLHHEITIAKRNGRSVGVFFFDLDEFKKTNDTFGHSAGDKLLANVGTRLKKYLRETDTIARPGGTINLDEKNNSDYLARIGGDEFTFIIPDISDKGITTGIAERILNLFKAPFEISGREVFISTSIGIAFYPDDGDDVETVIKNADTAMYKAKERGKNTFQYYSPDMNQSAKARIKVETKLRHAVKNSALQLYYQPQYNLDTAEMTGMEALIRWNDKEMGLVSPKDFIPVAEETGMIIEIGDWVLHSACLQGKIWQDQGFQHLSLGVNLSVRQFFDPHLVDKIKSALETTRFDPTCLELEITETAMMHDTDRAVLIMNEIKEMGIKISLDDFGTGYSSLVHLKLFHVDTLKIDQVFIRNADLKGRDGAIISSIIDMCHKLQIKAVAEGVETIESLTFLKEKKCHLAQGFFFSPPLPVEKFERLLYSRN
ncbi:MAG: EAL domain-containing protein [Desulfobacteraceae bacterium]|jgi:predicted signal transduction protein with EAL and GGDEF domain|nr:EAL domain-containing protein [Desulfobacteraceae bacterium]